MKKYLLNKQGKVGVKIFLNCIYIVIFRLGHFILDHPTYSASTQHNEWCNQTSHIYVFFHNQGVNKNSLEDQSEKLFNKIIQQRTMYSDAIDVTNCCSCQITAYTTVNVANALEVYHRK